MKPRTDSRKFKTISRRELLKLSASSSRWAPLLYRSCRNHSSRAASPSAIGRRQGCSALAIWHLRLRTPT